MNRFRTLIGGSKPPVAPLALNPLMALLAKEAGFEALYLSGGSLGYEKAVTEANMNVNDLAAAGLDIRSTCDLPLIMDAAGGWGDPMHMHRTIRMAEAAGFAAIEIEDQLLPKRAHHHIGLDHPIPTEEMVEKIKAAVAVRSDPDFVIIARTNTARQMGLDEALRRGEAFFKAGADMLLVSTKDLEHSRIAGEKLGAPQVFMTRTPMQVSPEELYKWGVRLIVEPVTPLWAAYEAMKQSYIALRDGLKVPPVEAAGGGRAVQDACHRTINLEALLEVERRTVEKSGGKH